MTYTILTKLLFGFEVILKSHFNVICTFANISEKNSKSMSHCKENGCVNKRSKVSKRDFKEVKEE